VPPVVPVRRREELEQKQERAHSFIPGPSHVRQVVVFAIEITSPKSSRERARCRGTGSTAS
jgi:hypothetical protein